MGSPATTIGDATTGHSGPFPPTTIAGGSGKVLIEGKPASAVGDKAIPHTRLKEPFDTHVPAISGGSSKVFIEGKPAARIGDPLDCGDTIASGSGKVLMG